MLMSMQEIQFFSKCSKKPYVSLALITSEHAKFAGIWIRRPGMGEGGSCPCPERETILLMYVWQICVCVQSAALLLMHDISRYHILECVDWSIHREWLWCWGIWTLQRKISYQNAITYMSIYNPSCKCRGLFNCAVLWNQEFHGIYVWANANALVHMYSKCIQSNQLLTQLLIMVCIPFLSFFKFEVPVFPRFASES